MSINTTGSHMLVNKRISAFQDIISSLARKEESKKRRMPPRFPPPEPMPSPEVGYRIGFGRGLATPANSFNLARNRRCWSDTCPLHRPAMSVWRERNRVCLYKGGFWNNRQQDPPHLQFACFRKVVPNRHIYSRPFDIVHWCRDADGNQIIDCQDLSHEHVMVHMAPYWSPNCMGILTPEGSDEEAEDDDEFFIADDFPGPDGNQGWHPPPGPPPAAALIAV